MNVTSLSGSAGRPTMREVAALAGVSLKTVSRVVNGEPGVSAEVHTRVLAAVQRLDYRPNMAASNLRRTGARSTLVGALVQDIANSFSASLLHALEDAARQRGTAVLAASLEEGADREEAMVHDLVTRRVDGLVIMPATERQDYLAAELRTGTPIVFVDQAPRGVDADSVTVDNRLGARLATETLIEGGHRRIAALLDLITITTATHRLEGFVAAHEAAGLSVDPALVLHGVRSADQAMTAMLALLDLADPPTAVFTGRNVLSIGVIRALTERRARLRIGQVGFDDFPLADLLDPSLTVIRQDVVRIGRMVAQMLFDRIDGDTSPPRHVVIEPTLVVRQSSLITP